MSQLYFEPPVLEVGHLGGGHLLFRCSTCGALWEQTLKFQCAHLRDRGTHAVSVRVPTMTDNSPAPNRRPRFPLGGSRELKYRFCAPPSSTAAAGEA